LNTGEFYFMQGDPADALFVLVEGRVKLSQSTADGQQVLLRILTPVALFGALTMTLTEQVPVSAETAQDSLALAWKKSDLMELVRRFPQLALNAMQFMSDTLLEFQDRYRQLATERVERRLARTILRLANQVGVKTAQGVLINLPLTRQDLAEMSGTTLFTVSRTLSQWEDQGLVLVGRERVVIRFPHGLVRIAEDLPE
jgi:CRP-like cAMP-binding protein